MAAALWGVGRCGRLKGSWGQVTRALSATWECWVSSYRWWEGFVGFGTGTDRIWLTFWEGLPACWVGNGLERAKSGNGEQFAIWSCLLQGISSRLRQWMQDVHVGTGILIWHSGCFQRNYTLSISISEGLLSVSVVVDHWPCIFNCLPRSLPRVLPWLCANDQIRSKWHHRLLYHPNSWCLLGAQRCWGWTARVTSRETSSQLAFCELLLCRLKNAECERGI